MQNKLNKQLTGLFFIILFFYNGVVFATNTQTINQKIKILNNQIQTINENLKVKKKKEVNLNQTLEGTQQAIYSSQNLLKALGQKKQSLQINITATQQTLNENNLALQAVKEDVSQKLALIYETLQALRNRKSSILDPNSDLDYDRKTLYLEKLLTASAIKYQELQAKINQLTQLNEQLIIKIKALNTKIVIEQKRQQELIGKKQTSLNQVSKLSNQIKQSKSQLADLKARQTRLNNLLSQLLEAERKKAELLAKAQKVKKDTPQMTRNAGEPQSENLTLNQLKEQANNLNNNPPTTKAGHFIKPLASGVIMTHFGAVSGGIKSNGVLLKAENVPIYALANAGVLYSGELPGFGHILVLDLGNDYTAVFSGIISQLKKNDTVKKCQLIANSGDSSNQPMGGVYFELRRLGRPINSNYLFK